MATDSDPGDAPSGSGHSRGASRWASDPLGALPLELGLRILSALRDPRDLCTCACVSRVWRALAEHDALWQSRCAVGRPLAIVEYGLRQSGRRPPWKEIFRRRTIVARNWHNARCMLYNMPTNADTYAVRFDPEITVMGGFNGSLAVMSTADGRRLPPLVGHTKSVRAVDMDARHVYSAGEDGLVIVWNRFDGTLLRRLAGHGDHVVALAACGGNTVLSGSWDGTVRAWNADTGDCVEVIANDGPVNALCARDGAFAANWGSSVFLYNALPGTNGRQQEHVRIDGHDDEVSSVQLTDALVLSASWDSTIKGWTRANGECAFVLGGHRSVVWQLRLVDDRWLVSAGWDGTMRLWSMEGDRRCLHVFEDHTSPISGMDANNCLILSCDEGGVVKAWDFAFSEFGSILPAAGYKFVSDSTLHKFAPEARERAERAGRRSDRRDAPSGHPIQ